MIRITLILLFMIGCGADDSKEEQEDLQVAKWDVVHLNQYVDSCQQELIAMDTQMPRQKAYNRCYCIGSHLARTYEVDVFISNAQEIYERDEPVFAECRRKYP